MLTLGDCWGNTKRCCGLLLIVTLCSYDCSWGVCTLFENSTKCHAGTGVGADADARVSAMLLVVVTVKLCA